MKASRAATLLLAALLAAGCEPRGEHAATPRSTRAGAPAADRTPRVMISEVMADPHGVPDERGEWIELVNAGSEAVELRGWRLESRSDAGHTLSGDLTVLPGAALVLARHASAVDRVDYLYPSGLTLANRTDWVKLVDRSGATVDSVAWNRPPTRGVARERQSFGPAPEVDGDGWASAEAIFGRGDRGTPGRVPGAGVAPVAAAARTEGAPGGVLYRSHVEFGVPRDATPSDDLILRKQQYVVSYNPRRGGPNWVAWNLNRTHFGDAPRSSSFTADAEVPERYPRITSSDYTGSGYDRGHMVRSEERTATPADNAATFLMTNILPQRHSLNAGPWLELERELQRLAVEEDREIYLLAGGVFPRTPRTLREAGRVAIPTSTWKIAVVLPRGEGLEEVRRGEDLRVIAVSMPNAEGLDARSWREFRTTVDAIEAATGYDFLAELPDPLEDRVEGRR